MIVINNTSIRKSLNIYLHVSMNNKQW